MKLGRFLDIERFLINTLSYVVECNSLTWETEVGGARWRLLRQHDLFLKY